MASIALGIAGILGAGASLASGAIGANAATTAAGEQTQAENNALNAQEGIWNQEQQNIAPYLSAGNTGISQLMAALGSGQFGAGSTGAVPQFNQTFTPPTLEQAQQTPGYQFTAQQGSKGILEGAGAAGGAISGGTLKSLDQYNTNLANNTYGSIFNQALQTYGAGLQGYNANLAGYQTGLQSQQQQFNQLLAPAEIGAGAAGSLNQQGTATAQNIGQIMAGIGNAQAAGTVGSAQALSSGLTGATNTLGNGVNGLLYSSLLTQLLNGGSGLGAGGSVSSGVTGSGPSITAAQAAALGLGPG